MLGGRCNGGRSKVDMAESFSRWRFVSCIVAAYHPENKVEADNMSAMSEGEGNPIVSPSDCSASKNVDGTESWSCSTCPPLQRVLTTPAMDAYVYCRCSKQV